ncbi:MAG: hypothetical protein Alpg2KO_33880 [Alphaproteobacteria bacterium]
MSERSDPLLERLVTALAGLGEADHNIVLSLLDPGDGPGDIFEVTTVRHTPLDEVMAPLHEAGLAARRYTMQSRLALSGDNMNAAERAKWESFVGYTLTPDGLTILAEAETKQQQAQTAGDQR